MGFLRESRRQQVVQESGNRDIGFAVVGRGLLEGNTSGWVGCRASRIHVRLDCHRRGRLSFGSLSGNTVQGSRKSTCGGCKLSGIDRGS